jgi:large subunit ribosomal protein L32e
MESTEYLEGEAMDKEEFVKIITSIRGIGKVKAELLYESGFDSIEKIRRATVRDLTKVKGVSESLAEEIKKELGELEKKEEEEEEIEPSEKEYSPKKKPRLSEEKKRGLLLRSKKRKPKFLRQEWFRYKRLGKTWRKPRGLHSKYRKNLKYRPPLVRIGFRVPKAARGLHPSGFEEVLVHRVEDLEGIDPDVQAIRIGATVGTRKRIRIRTKADELGIRILNRGEL